MKHLYRSLTLLATAFCAAAQPAEEALRRMQESKQQVVDYLIRAARSVTNDAADEISSRVSWESVKKRRGEELRDMLGLLPWPQRTPLEVQITGRLDQPSYVIEKIAFQSLPRLYVTANLYIPRGPRKPLPAVIYVCAHNGGKDAYQHYGQILARNGYVTFILDPIQNAEAFGFHHGVYDMAMYEWYSRGYTPGGVEVWNAIRAIDYLQTRAEVDRSRIGMTGFSGGASITYFTAAVDPRIKAAAPFMGISTYAANLQEGVQDRNCDCMYPVNSARHDLMHIGALIAPRPLLAGQGVEDGLFPQAGYREFAKRIGGLYEAYGQADRFQLLEIAGGHADTDVMREATVRWFDKYLLGIPDRKPDLAHTPLPKAALLVFPNGAPREAQNFRAHELLTPQPALRRFSSLAGWKSRRAELLKVLRSSVLARVPQTPREVRVERVGDLRTASMRCDDLVVSSRDTVPVHALMRRMPNRAGRGPGILYVGSDGEEQEAVGRTLRGLSVPWDWAVMAVFPRGVGEIPWSRMFHTLTLRNAMPVGETIDSMRLSDILVAIEALRGSDRIDPERISIMGRGVSGALGLYAAILDARIREVILIEPPSTHVEGPVFLNVLRYTDLPEAAALLAPRPLKFYMRVPAPYQYTQHIYDLYGKPDGVQRIARVIEN